MVNLAQLAEDIPNAHTQLITHILQLIVITLQSMTASYLGGGRETKLATKIWVGPSRENTRDQWMG